PGRRRAWSNPNNRSFPARPLPIYMACPVAPWHTRSPFPPSRGMAPSASALAWVSVWVLAWTSAGFWTWTCSLATTCFLETTFAGSTTLTTATLGVSAYGANHRTFGLPILPGQYGGQPHPDADAPCEY